jgi:hypothetical protein
VKNMKWFALAAAAIVVVTAAVVLLVVQPWTSSASSANLPYGPGGEFPSSGGAAPTAPAAPAGPTAYQLQEAFRQGQWLGQHSDAMWKCLGAANAYGSGPYRAELQAQFRDGCAAGY